MAGKTDNKNTTEDIRLDKWLWAARLFKTRSQAADAIDAGQVRINNTRIKPSRNVKVGDLIAVSKGPFSLELTVAQLSCLRGSAPIAATLYNETPASISAREAQKNNTEKPLHTSGNRPTKKDRRMLDKFAQR